MDFIILLLTFLISKLLVLTPPFAVWRSFLMPASGRAAWLYHTLALIGPSVAAFIFVVLMWLPTYSGHCGGWLGETSPCSGLGQYATETMFWAAMSMVMPSLLGMLLGISVLIVLQIRHRASRPAALSTPTVPRHRH